MLKDRSVVPAPITQYFKVKEGKYELKSAPQNRIRRAIVKFIVKCSMPLVVVKAEEFCELIEQSESEFNPMSM